MYIYFCKMFVQTLLTHNPIWWSPPQGYHCTQPSQEVEESVFWACSADLRVNLTHI